MTAFAHGATFTFSSSKGSFQAKLTRLSVEYPVAEVADLTGVSDAQGQQVLVPTGDKTGGSISIEYALDTRGAKVDDLVCGVGQLSFASSGLSVSKNVILESCSQGASVGDVVRGSAKFLITDYYGR